MGKLVRDRIPDIIRATGRVPVIEVLGYSAYESALHDKLLEEAAELRAAEGVAESLSEAADVLEVLIAVAALRGFSLGEVVSAAREKAAERGGLKDRIWLERIEEA